METIKYFKRGIERKFCFPISIEVSKEKSVKSLSLSDIIGKTPITTDTPPMPVKSKTTT